MSFRIVAFSFCFLFDMNNNYIKVNRSTYFAPWNHMEATKIWFEPSKQQEQYKYFCSFYDNQHQW